MITYKISYIRDHERIDYFVQTSDLKRLFLDCLECLSKDCKLLSIEPVNFSDLDECAYFDVLEKRLDGLIEVNDN